MRKLGSIFLCLVSILPVFAGKVDLRIENTNNWLFLAPEWPQLTITVIHRDKEPVNLPVMLSVTTDTYTKVLEMEQIVNVNADSTVVKFKFQVPNPGFYRCTVSAPNTESRNVNIGYEPECIVSLPDAQPDFDTFWQDNLSLLANVAPEYSMTEENDKSGHQRKVYKVQMKSLGGEPISGYLTMPVKKNKKYPVVIHYMGYANKPWYAMPEDHPQYIEFVLSVRGQALQESTNKYGDWFVYGLESKENYYYRGAFMDIVRAIDFVMQLPQTDDRYIFAEGGSQGGAFTLVACALDKRIKAASPWIPFLTDYTDYFKIVPWPANITKKRQIELGITDGQLYETLSYFDMKNFARKITCPILMGWGMQDEICPPHTNFGSYNLITSPKEHIEYPYQEHNVDHADWDIRQFDFFLNYMNTHK